MQRGSDWIKKKQEKRTWQQDCKDEEYLGKEIHGGSYESHS